MKRWLAALAAIALWCSPAKAQDFVQSYNFINTGTSTATNSFANTGVTSFFISWFPQVTLVSCAVQVDSSADGVTWGSGDLIASQSCATSGSSGPQSLASGKNFLRLHVTSLTGNGGLNVTLKGWGPAGAGSFPPTSSGKTQLTYDTTTQSFHVTRTDNTFGTVFILDNLNTPGFAARQNDYHHIDINVDGQADYTTSHFSGGVYGISSILDLDQDGHFGLAAGSGSSDNGIATDPSTFEVCLGATRNPISCKSFATRFNTSSQLSSLVGAPTVGVGMPGIVFRSQTSRSTNLSFTIPALNGGSNTTSAACVGSVGDCPSSVGLYEIISVFTVSVAGSGSTLLVQVSYTDDVQAETNKACTLTGPGGVGTAAQSMVNVGDTLTADCKFWAAANTNITLVWTFAGTAPTVSAKTLMLSLGQ